MRKGSREHRSRPSSPNEALVREEPGELDVAAHDQGGVRDEETTPLAWFVIG